MIAAAALLVVAACAGSFQRELPPAPQTFCRTGAGALLVGAATADVTPEVGCYLAGFDLNRRSTSIHSPLEVRAAVFVCGGAKIAIVGIDNLGLQRDDADWIKAGVAGFPNGCVFLCSSHTHAGPDLVGIWGPYLLASGRDRGYLALVRRRVAEAVAAAEAAARPARLLRAEARLPADGLVRNSNRAGVWDRRFTVLLARERDGDGPIASVLHLACHPEVLRRRNTAVSADFVGALCDRWLAAGLGIPVFVNGALGAMVSPVPRGVDGVAAMGAALAELGESAIDSAVEVPVESIEVRRRDVFLPMESAFLRLGRLTMAIPREVHRNHIRTTVGYLRLGGVEIVTLPGEIEPGLATRLRGAVSNPELLVFGLVDDEVGYLLSARDARDPLFAYERGMSPGPTAGELVVAALAGR